MNVSSNQLSRRWLILIVAVISMLFAGILYAWSILKVPFSEEFGWGASDLALNFTLTMCFFCIGGFLGSQLTKRLGAGWSTILSGALAGAGIVLTGCLSDSNVLYLFITYSLMAGLGIGIAYNVVISTVNAWFPDKKGLCSGCLMMGFGASSLILGNLAGYLFDSSAFGWRKTYILIGIALGVVLMITGLFIRRPGSEVAFPSPKVIASRRKEQFEAKDYTTSEMLCSFTFWRAFICLICLTAVGNSVISFARDLTISVGAAGGLATTLVGVLSVCNGLGRIITGAVFDAFGRRFTMIAANLLTIVAAGITLLAVSIHSLPLCIIGLCLTGLSYGSAPTVASAFTSAFYGQKHFASNFSIVNFNLMGASFVATACSSLMVAFGGYTVPFILLLALSVLALVLNFSIRRP